MKPRRGMTLASVSPEVRRVLIIRTGEIAERTDKKTPMGNPMVRIVSGSKAGTYMYIHSGVYVKPIYTYPQAQALLQR